MIPTKLQIEEVHKRYAQNETVYNLVYEHCQIVAEIAQWCVDSNRLSVNNDLLQAACLLHDIGTYALFDAKGALNNPHNYKQHAVFGAALIIEEGFDPQIAEMVRTHVLMGISKGEVIEHSFGLPRNDYLPGSLEAEILCYADRFHTKLPVFNDYDTFLTKLKTDLPRQAEKLKEAAVRFGIPNVAKLAEQYGHPIQK